MAFRRLIQGCCVLGLLAMFGACGAVGQAADTDAPPIRFGAVGQGRSMSSNAVAALAQDRAGFIWIGTGAGLLRFDGYGFRVMQRSDLAAAGKASSPAGAIRGAGLGFVRALLAARDGRLWVGTESDGLAVYDPASGRLQGVRRNGKDSGATGREGTIRALAEDTDGAIWVGTLGGGLARLDPASGHLTQYRHADSAPGSLPDDRVQSLLVDRRGALWVGTWRGLSVRRPGAQAFEPIELAGTGAAGLGIVTALHEADDGRIWLGTQQGRLGRVEPGSATAEWLDERTELGAINAFVTSTATEIWAARQGGIEIRGYDGRLDRVLRHDVRDGSSLADNEVRAMLRDSAGWLWVGGLGAGLQRHNPTNQSVAAIRRLVGMGRAIDEPSPRALLQLDNGEIWAGLSEGGVLVLDAALRMVAELKPGAGGQPSLGQGRIGALAQAEGSVWVASEAGLQEFNAKSRALMRSLQMGGARVRRLHHDGQGRLWVATQDGLYLLARGARTLLRVPDQTGKPARGDVNALVEDADGAIWVGAESGLYRIGASGEPALHRVKGRTGSELTHMSVVGLLIDRERRLWIDTAIGLHQMTDWDGDTAAFTAISFRHGVSGRAFGANLLEDWQGRIWTHQGVYDPASDRLQELTAADGVDFGTGWFRSYTALRDGRMLFGGSRGLLLIDAAKFAPWQFQPPVVVTDLRVDGQLASTADLRDGFVLRAGQRSFSLELAALDYSDPSQCRYRYRLDGVSDDWTEIGADFRVISFGQLDPGSYGLRVQATNRSGVWSVNELRLKVTVEARWWQTWWARVGLGVLAAGLVVLAVQLRTRLLRNRQRMLHDLVQERTRDLEKMSRMLQIKTDALEDSSLTDPLTGLRNRRFLTQHIESDVALSIRMTVNQERKGLPFTGDADLIFLMLDLDHFKSVNDEHGHAAGDAMLNQMRARLQGVFRDADYLVRWGGEEFLVVARATQRSFAFELAERAREAVASVPFAIGGGVELSRTCSVGFAVFPLSQAQPDAVSWTATVELADAALYAAKRAGRNRATGVVNADKSASPDVLQRAVRAATEQWPPLGVLEVRGTV